MRIISFGHTTPALLAGAKTVTRRDWAEKTIEEFRGVYQRGELVQAWNQSPRVKGSARVGTIRLTEAPYQELTSLAPSSDYRAEGFEYLTGLGLTVFGLMPVTLWRTWHEQPVTRTVVRFELLEVACANCGALRYSHFHRGEQERCGLCGDQSLVKAEPAIVADLTSGPAR